MSGPATGGNHFPFKLYFMLEYASSEDLERNPQAISWSEDGQAFVIRDREAFLKRIVPRFFKQTKFRSFMRQLNAWGFTRACKQSEIWRHEHFVRGTFRRLYSIKRLEDRNVKIESKPETKDECRQVTGTVRNYGPTTQLISSLVPGTTEKSIAAVTSPSSSSLPNSLSESKAHAPKVVATWPMVQSLTDEVIGSSLRPKANTASVPPTVAQLSRNKAGDSGYQFHISPSTVQSVFGFRSTGSQNAPGDVTRDDMLHLLSSVFESEDAVITDEAVNMPSLDSDEVCEDL
mmetsp:Transcript_22050/g.47322  ORF Transcript_22050/g.47322 Transcript_22050/m.47322 type:complete len:289 (+) Transcript_22050:94-960(+)